MFQFIKDLLRPTESQVDKELKARELKVPEASKLAEFTERNGTEGAFAHVLRRRFEVRACDDIVHGWMDDDWTTARPEDGEILKVLTGEQSANALHKEVKAAVRLEMAGVQGTARAKKFTSQLVRPGSVDNSNAILMVDAGKHALSEYTLQVEPSACSGSLVLSVADVEAFAFQGTVTIAQMHHMGGITHNDVKPANWVVNKRDERHKRQTGSMFEFTLVDFGSSTTNDVNGDTGAPVSNTHIFMDPLMWQSLSDRASKKKEERGEFKQNGFRNDMFAFGKAVVELLGGKLILYDDGVEGAKTNNKDLVDLLHGVTTLNAKGRWSMQRVLESAFMQNFAKTLNKPASGDIAHGAMDEVGLDGGGASQGKGKGRGSDLSSEAASMAGVCGVASHMPAATSLSTAAAAAAPSAMFFRSETAVDLTGVGGKAIPTLATPTGAVRAAGNIALRQSPASRFGMLGGAVQGLGIRGTGGAAGSNPLDDEPAKAFAKVPVASQPAAMGGSGTSTGGGLSFGGAAGFAGTAPQHVETVKHYMNVRWGFEGMGASMGAGCVGAGGGFGFGGTAGSGCRSLEEQIAEQYAGVPLLSDRVGGSGTSAGKGLGFGPAAGSAGPALEVNEIARDYSNARMVSAAMGPSVWAGGFSESGGFGFGGCGVAQSQDKRPAAAGQEPVAEVAASPASAQGEMARVVATAEVAGSASASSLAGVSVAPAAPASASTSAAAPVLASPPATVAAPSSAFIPALASEAPTVAAAPAVARALPPVTRAQASLAASLFTRITRSQTAQQRAESGGVDERSTIAGTKRARDSEVVEAGAEATEEARKRAKTRNNPKTGKSTGGKSRAVKKADRTEKGRKAAATRAAKSPKNDNTKVASKDKSVTSRKRAREESKAGSEGGGEGSGSGSGRHTSKRTRKGVGGR